MNPSLFPREDQLGLVTDLYELTMAAAYWAEGMADQKVSFELWIRRMPGPRNYLVAAGLEQAIHYLKSLSFSPEQIAWLRKHPSFQHVPSGWFDALATLGFDGDVWAVPEGTVVFAGEPLMRITGSIMFGQIVETYLITTITAQTMVASKAARVVTAAQGRETIDFGSRRAHGPQAGFLAARAAYIGGFAATSNAEAARLLGIPAVGTQAHAWIMAHDSEVEAFRKFGQLFPDSTLLIDTYDTAQGARNAIASGASFRAVRLDSGDLLALSQEVRRILDDAGKRDVQIVVSGDLNEYKVRDLLAAGAPIDVFGVGTELVTSRDEPTLSTVYKLVEQRTAKGIVGRAKRSTGKATYPFAKQVFRSFGSDGRMAGDLLARDGEVRSGEPLLTPVMIKGELTKPLPTLSEIRTRCGDEVRRLPDALRKLEPQEPYVVEADKSVQA